MDTALDKFRPWVLAAFAVASSVSAGACTSSNDGTCEAVCLELQECGFLPSPLGAGDTKGTKNCKDECDYATDYSVNTIANCFTNADDDDAGTARDTSASDEPWCGPQPKCPRIASCLTATLRKASYLGVGGVVVTIVDAPATTEAQSHPDRTVDPYSTDTVCRAMQEHSSRGGSTISCDAHDIVALKYNIEPGIGDSRPSKPIPCLGSLAPGWMTPKTIQPGWVSASVEVQLRTQPSEPTQCLTLRAPPVLLAAGALLAIQIPLSDEEVRSGLRHACDVSLSSAAAVSLMHDVDEDDAGVCDGGACIDAGGGGGER